MPDQLEGLYKNITQLTEKTRKIFVLYASLSFFCIISVINTTDKYFVLDKSINLPVININLNINGFFIVAPLIVLFFFSYFHIHLYSIHNLIQKCKESNKVDENKIHRWILSYPCENEKIIFTFIQNSIIRISKWYLLIITLLIFSFWYIKKHEPVFSYIICILIPVIGFILIILFKLLYLNIQKIKKVSTIISIAIIILLIMYSIVKKANNGEYKIGSFFNIKCSYTDFIKDKKVPEGLYIYDLKNIHLEKADLSYSVLKNVDFKLAHLEGANMEFAHLEKANMEFAHLEGANLGGARLEEANLFEAHLEGADLTLACLEEADLGGANLKGANLGNAHLKGANLGGANLKEADLGNAHLEGANLFQAYLKGANLGGAHFKGADLADAKTKIKAKQLLKVKSLYKVAGLDINKLVDFNELSKEEKDFLNKLIELTPYKMKKYRETLDKNYKPKMQNKEKNKDKKY